MNLKQKLIILLLCCVTTYAFAQTDDVNFGIIPAPQSLLVKSGTFKLDKNTALQYETEADRQSAQLFRDLVKDKEGIDLVLAKNFVKAPESMISFNSANASGFSPEAYALEVNEKQISLNGSYRGVFYATQTLIQLYLNGLGNHQIQQMKIVDEPRYAYRGLHLDVGRHMFPVSFIKKYIDIMAMYKLNNFHWHLTEDQGWRIEIKKYPKLTQIGGYRDQTIIGNYHKRMPQWFDGTKYGGFYTQEEVKDIVAYAQTKYINVIPEIDMPGHAMAALSGYPELACGDNPGPFKAAEKWGVFPDIFCAGKEHTYDFLEDVLKEVMDLFPSKYIHIGGDEAPKTMWKTCPHCQKRIKKSKLKNEEELQSYFIHRLEKFVNKNGRSIIGWDEILEGGLAPNATVMSWRGTKGGIAAAKQNHYVIMTPSTNGLYLDHTQGVSSYEPVGIGGSGTIDKIYSYDPTPQELTASQKQYILGVQANMWTEYMQTAAKVEYMLFPRVYALSEIAWTNLDRKNYKNFIEERVPKHLSWLDQTETLYRVPAPIGVTDTTINVNGSYTFNLKPSVIGAKIYYTIDDHQPSEITMPYTQSFEVKVPKGEYRPVKFIEITPSGKRSAVTTTILRNVDPLKATSAIGNLKQGGLRYHYVPGNFNLSTEIDTSLATQRGVVPAISYLKIPKRAREFGVVFTGYINVNENANFEFSISSDDGSRLYIDDELIIDNDGNHARWEKSAGVELQAGLHKIKVSYFDVGPGSLLKVFVKGTDGKKIEIPAVMLYQ